MLQDNELFTAALGLAVLIFLLTQLRDLRVLPKPALLLAAFVLLVAGWITTLVEGVLWPTALNLAEHGFYALSGTCLAVWCWTALGSSRPRA